MSFSRRDIGYLEDIFQACHDIQEYVAGLTEDEFRRNGMARDAVIRQITIIGEAAAHLGEEAMESQPSVSWRQIVGMRHVLVHGYRQIRLDEVWRTATVDVPALLAAVEPLLPPPPED